MAIFDQSAGIQYVHLGNLTLSGTTPALSSYAALAGFNAATIVIVNNTVTDAGAAAGFTATLQESADAAGASASAVAATDVPDQATVTVDVTSDGADNAIAGTLNYIGAQPYVGVTVTGTAGTDADVSVYAVLGKPDYEPVTVIGTAVSRT